MSGGVIAQVAVGRHVLQLGDPCGAVIREAPRAERGHFRPRLTPILLRPRSIRSLVDRRMDLAEALSALDAGLAVEVSGEPGIGKTAVLRSLAHHPRAASFADGIVYVAARHQVSLDLQQVLFDAFYESDELYRPTEAEIRRGLQDIQALILLDDVRLTPDELEQVLDIVPRAAFVVTTRERRLWAGVHSLGLKAMPAEDAVLLLEREIERSLDPSERSGAAALCAAIGGNPLRILQAAAVIREQGISLDGWAHVITQGPIVNLMASTDEKQRRALLALAALPGVPLRTLHVSGIADLPDIEPSLTALTRRGLVVSSESRYQLADGVGDRLRRTEDLKPWANRAITYFTAWAERYQRSQDMMLQESEVLLRVQECATDTRRSGEVLHLGRLLEGSLVAGARWGAWAVTLERCLAAAKTIGDRSAEAWALHELGSRALCLGEAATARVLLQQAVKLRETLNDDAGAAASRQNLGFVLQPVSQNSRGRATTPLDDVLDLGSLPLRDDIPPAMPKPNTRNASAVLAAVLFVAILGGFAYWTHSAGLSFRSWSLASIGSSIQTSFGSTTAPAVTMPTPQRAASEPGLLHHDEPGAVSSSSESVALASDLPLEATGSQALVGNRASILIFTSRPGSITTGGPTRLCYAVSEALQARLEPDIGEVAPTRTLTCLRVAPAHATTYRLTAYGRDGHQVSQRLVIVVR